MPYTDTVENRFWKFVHKTDTCWIWVGCINHQGYGHLSVNAVPARAHRVSYELHKGKIPAGMYIDHLCKNKKCVNPDHLEVVTPHESGSRIEHRNLKKTHCPKGHEYNEENTIRRRGGRECKTCVKEYNRKKNRERQLLKFIRQTGQQP